MELNQVKPQGENSTADIKNNTACHLQESFADPPYVSTYQVGFSRKVCFGHLCGGERCGWRGQCLLHQPIPLWPVSALDRDGSHRCLHL